MLFNVAQLLKESIGATRHHRVDESLPSSSHTWADARGVPAGRVLGSVRLLRTDRGVWVSGRLDTAAVCECSRCLREFEQPVSITIDDEFASDADATPDPWSVLEEEGFRIDSNQILDISEAVRQYSYLNLPMKPTCGDDCAGICATCGANLNEAACACDAGPADPRWDALLKLVSAGAQD